MRKFTLAILAILTLCGVVAAQEVKTAKMYEALTLDLENNCKVGEVAYECLTRSYTIARFYEAASLLCQGQLQDSRTKQACHHFFFSQDAFIEMVSRQKH